MNGSILQDLPDPIANKNAKEWLGEEYDPKTREEVLDLLTHSPEEAVDAFYKNLNFGTGGMRGIMGVGTNRMNNYTIRKASQGLANYLKKTITDTPSVLIGYDSRKHSREFADEAAKVLASNGIEVYLFEDLRPTPLVSFGCRFKKCSAAIMITASHNPKQYNGFKVYWQDGGQVLPPHDQGIVDEIVKIESIKEIKSDVDLSSPLIHLVEEEIDDAYLIGLQKLALNPELSKKEGKNLKILYTSLHGTGIALAPRALRLLGFTSISFVLDQIKPDGDFPNAPFPNPEEASALKLGVEQLLATNQDLLIATDPDADRMGVVVNHHGKAITLTGNQIACLLVKEILNSLVEAGQLPSKAAFVKSVVTTDLFKAIVEKQSATCFEVLPGFKYIAELIRNWEQESESYQFIFGAEESYGYLYGTQARDKDAIGTSLLIAETALRAKLAGKTLIDLLDDLYKEFGIYHEEVLSVGFDPGKSGAEKMKAAMLSLRDHPLETIGTRQVEKTEDFLVAEGKSTHLPPSDFLIYHLEGGNRLMVRPSGTEPKIKIYCGIIEERENSLEEGQKKAAENAKVLLEAFKSILLKE